MKHNSKVKLVAIALTLAILGAALFSCGEFMPSQESGSPTKQTTLSPNVTPTAPREEESTPAYQSTPHSESAPVPETTVTPDSAPTPETTVTPDSAPVPETTVTPDSAPTPETTVTPDSAPVLETTITPDTEPETTVGADECAHDYGVKSIHEKTCTVDGFTVYECASCGDEYVGDVIAAEGHGFGEWEVVEHPEIGKNGLDVRVCPACGSEQTRITSFGEAITPDSGNIAYGYYEFSNLEGGEEMQAFYREMLRACREFAAGERNVEADEEGIYVIEYISVKEYTVPLVKLAAAWKIFVESNPSYYWLSNDILIQDNKFFFAIDGEYASYEYRQQCDAAIADMASEAQTLISKSDNDLEVAMKLHDFLAERLEYAYVDGTKIPESAVWAHNIVGAAVYGKGVCESYAKAYLYLCTLNGLDNIIVSGYAGEAHVWNYVRLDGEWYAVDVTWSDGGSEYSKYLYFGLCESTVSKDHTNDLPTGEGLSYLYELPETGARDLCPVILYEGDMELDTFINAETAFEVMIDASAEYTVRFMKNDSVISSELLPSVRAITFVGMNRRIDETHFYGQSTLTFTESVTFLCDVTFENVCVSGSLDLADYTLTTEGFYCRLSGSISGNESALIIDKTEYKTEIDAETTVAVENR